MLHIKQVYTSNGASCFTSKPGSHNTIHQIDSDGVLRGYELSSGYLTTAFNISTHNRIRKIDRIVTIGSYVVTVESESGLFSSYQFSSDDDVKKMYQKPSSVIKYSLSPTQRIHSVCNSRCRDGLIFFTVQTLNSFTQSGNLNFEGRPCIHVIFLGESRGSSTILPCALDVSSLAPDKPAGHVPIISTMRCHPNKPLIYIGIAWHNPAGGPNSSSGGYVTVWNYFALRKRLLARAQRKLKKSGQSEATNEDDDEQDDDVAQAAVAGDAGEPQDAAAVSETGSVASRGTMTSGSGLKLKMKDMFSSRLKYSADISLKSILTTPQSINLAGILFF